MKKIISEWKAVALFAFLFIGAPNAALAAEDEEANEVEEIVVTGSRIARSSADSDSNISIISRQELEDFSVTSIGDFLQDIPQNVGGLNAQNNNGGNGSTQLSLRNLGSGRTLVLINGRRHVPYATGGTVDLNAIAPSTIERVDVLLDGASSVYGADAVAGVVNVITRNDFEGAEFSIFTGASSEGDGEIVDWSLTMGTTSDRGNIMMMLGGYEMKEVMAGDRGWARQDLDYDWANGIEAGLGSSATPEGTIIDRLGQEGNAAWQAIAYQPIFSLLWGPGGNNPSQTWSPFQFTGNSDVGEGSYYNYQPENYLYTPQERTNMFITGNYELLDGVNGFMELSYINRKSDQLLAPTPLFIISEGITIDAGQAFNPFGRDFIDVRRRMVEAGNRNFIQDIDTYRMVGGIEFSLEDWDVELSVNVGRTDGTDTNEGRFIRSRVINALSADCTGSCVPLNLFGGPGSITQDQIDYISYTGTAKTTYEQTSFELNVSNASVFELPAGDVGLAFGIQKRDEEGKFVEDPLTEAGDTTGNKGESTRGSYSVEEAYLELAIPVFDNSTLGNMNLSLSSRYSDYSNFGDTNNSKVGFRWDLNNWIAFRGTFSEAFKAPSVASLFAGQSDSFPAVTDPCSNIVGAYGTDATVTANCDADGLVGGTADPNEQLRTRVGGNPNLGPETAETTQFGVILNPIQDLSVTVDWWDYEIENTIGTIGAGTILGNCYFNADRKYCDKIERDNNGLVSNIFAAATNIGEVGTSGIDVQADYYLSAGDLGSFNFSLDYTAVDEYEIRTPTAAGTLSITDCVGVYDCGTLIENRWIATASWNRDKFNARLRVNFYDEFTECEGDFCGGDEIRRTIDSVAYVTLGLGYDLGQGTRFNLNVYNLTDENPPRIYNGFYSAADVAYDFLGQYYTLGISHKF